MGEKVGPSEPILDTRTPQLGREILSRRLAKKRVSHLEEEARLRGETILLQIGRWMDEHAMQAELVEDRWEDVPPSWGHLRPEDTVVRLQDVVYEGDWIGKDDTTETVAMELEGRRFTYKDGTQGPFVYFTLTFNNPSKPDFHLTYTGRESNKLESKDEKLVYGEVQKNSQQINLNPSVSQSRLHNLAYRGAAYYHVGQFISWRLIRDVNDLPAKGSPDLFEEWENLIGFLGGATLKPQVE